MRRSAALATAGKGRDVSRLFGLRAQALRGRREYLKYLRSLPDPLGSLCATFYEQRVKRVAPKPLLGEYLPWFIGDLLGIPTTVTSRVAACWLPLYLQILAIDDLLDRSAETQPELLPIVATVFGEQGHLAYMRLLGNDDRFWEPFNRYWLRMGVAGAREIQLRRGKIARISPHDWAAAGEKIELVKVCYTSLALASGRNPRPEDLRALEDFAVGSQLFDDISDWEEDLAIGNFTPLLSRAFRGKKPITLTRDGSLVRIVESGALASCIAECERRFERAAARSGFDPGSRGIRFLRLLVANLRELGRLEVAAAVALARQKRRVDHPGHTERTGQLTRDEGVTRVLRRLDESIRVVAQSS